MARKSNPSDPLRRTMNVIKQGTTVRKSHPFAFVLFGTSLITFLLPAATLAVLGDATGFNIPDVLNYYAAIWLTLFAIPVAFLGVIQIENLWMWYVLVVTWLMVFKSIQLPLAQWTGNLNRAQMEKGLTGYAMGIGWGLTIGVIIGSIVYGTDVGIHYGVEIYLAVFMNVFSLPIAIFTDLMSFSPEIWIVVVLCWIMQLSLARRLS